MTSNRVATAKKFISHYATLDEGILEAILADNYTHEYAPSSLPHPPYDKKGLIDFLLSIKNMFKAYPMTIKEIIESESSNAVTVWTSSHMTFQDEVKDEGTPEEEWQFNGEYMYLFYFNETGDKIVRTMEFLDSKAAADKLLPLVAKAQANLASRSG